MSEARYRVTIHDRQSQSSRTFDVQVLVQHLNERYFFGRAAVTDLQLDCRYVKQVAIRRRPKALAYTGELEAEPTPRSVAP